MLGDVPAVEERCKAFQVSIPAKYYNDMRARCRRHLLPKPSYQTNNDAWKIGGVVEQEHSAGRKGHLTGYGRCTRRMMRCA